ncbi:hypothetical protein SAMN05421754_100692 [Nitrosomonas sp. Nm58]|nr:hypothetical protein SAMN05421754_100692 [Nitrosomonas sp. Nm58]
MDNVAQGRIVLEGTSAGIRDLVVVIYDMDPRYYNEFSTSVTHDDPIEHLYTNPQVRAWIDFPGDRIGSVLTDQHGRFELVYSDAAFRVRNNEKRPDLVLFVLGPDRAPASTLMSRLLHYALIPRANAGHIESYVISMPAALLRSRGVFLPERGTDPDTLSTQLEQDRIRRQQIADSYRAMVRNHLSARVPWLNRVNAFQRSIPRLLLKKANGASSRLVIDAGEQEATLRTAAISGLGSLARYRPELAMRLRLTPELLGRLRIAPDTLEAGGSVEVPVCDLLAQKGLAGQLTRVRSLLDQHAARVRAQSVVASDLSGGEVTPEVEPSVPERVDTLTFIRDRILGQVSQLPEFTTGRSSSTIEELEKIKATINRLELSGGPANVTAFHDFHSLQVAFEDVWIAAFDKRLRESVLDLYRQSTALHEEYGLELPPMEDIADANGLRQYIDQLNGRITELEIIPIPSHVQETFPQLTLKIWNQLDEDGRNVLRTTATEHTLPWSAGNDIDPPLDLYASQTYLDERYDIAIKRHLNSPLARAERLILDISERLNEPYEFRYFAPGSANYGILLIYRQEWTPETYQVGRLINTVPLAPGEKRNLKITRKVHKTRAEKAIEKALVESTNERQFTTRTELDVMAKVANSSNFRMTATGSFNIGIGQIGASSEFGMNQSAESSRQKKQFLEAVQKAAEHVRQETEVSVESTESFESSAESTTELSNPNNELTVTYLLYELERRYRVTSRPHQLTPVILVAQDIPAPHEITEGWLLEHAWIIRRILLDERFLEALDYLEDGLEADAIDVDIKKANWETQRTQVGELESDVQRLLDLRHSREDSIVSLLLGEKTANAEDVSDEERVARAIFSGGLSELFDGGSSNSDELLRARREASEKALEFLNARLESASEKLSSARKSLQETAHQYSAAVKERARRDTMIRQLRLHVRQNILHYMHGIWDYRHPDQQFFELNDWQVPFVESATSRCRLRRATPGEEEAGVVGIQRDGDLYIVECDPPIPPDPSTPLATRRLGSVADLNNPLGYKGNYIIFPLKTCTHITDFMSQEYVDDYFGLRDPSTRLGYTGEELLAYANAVLHDPTSSLSNAERDSLLAAVTRELTQSSETSQRVILPTGQLYMEALKGEQSLLEDFKLAHRGMDVLKVQEDIRGERLENLRRALRLVNDEPDLTDPDIEKVVIVQGATHVSLPVDGDA